MLIDQRVELGAGRWGGKVSLSLSGAPKLSRSWNYYFE